MQHITVIHSGAVGDLLAALPALRAVRARWPAARITVLGRPERAALAVMAGAADDAADIETSGLWRLMGPKPARGSPLPAPLAGADLVLDFFSNGSVAAAMPGRPVISVQPLPPDGWTESAAAWILSQLKTRLALPDLPREPEIAVPPEAIAAARAGLGGAADKPLAAIHPGSGSLRKNWPMDRFEEIARRLRGSGLCLAWVIGPAEVERGTRPAVAPGDALLEDVPLPRLAGVLAAAVIYVGNDSGVAHLAAAVRGHAGRRTPTVVLFGPSDPRVWAPRGPHVHVVRSPTGAMGAISADDVWHEVARAISGS